MSLESIQPIITPYRCFVYNKEGQSKLVESIEERDKLYATGEWFTPHEAEKRRLIDEIEREEAKIKSIKKEAARKNADSVSKKDAEHSGDVRKEKGKGAE